MSIGRRLIDLARAELNSLLDRAAKSEDEDERGSWGRGSGGEFEAMSDAELEEELERRRQAREEVNQATRGPRPTTAGRPAAGTDRRPFEGFRAEQPRRTAAGDEAIRKAYVALEIPPGSDFEAVRKSYRRLMRKYHPDLHATSPEKQRAATDRAQRLTESYKLLEKQLRR